MDPLGRGVSLDAYGDGFRALCGEAAVTTAPLHNVRHTLALMLHRAGRHPPTWRACSVTRSPPAHAHPKGFEPLTF